MLRTRREEQGISQTTLAELSGVPQYTISKIERGETEFPAFENVVRIGDALGYSASEIAAAAKLSHLADRNWEAANLEPELATMLDAIRLLGSRIEPEQQREFAIRLEVAIELQRRALERGRQRHARNGAIPLWLRHRSRSENGDYEEET